MEELDYNRFKDASPFDSVPLAGPLASLILAKGIHESREKSKALYQSGREAAETFFDVRDFSKYVDKNRRGKPRIDRGTAPQVRIS